MKRLKGVVKNNLVVLPEGTQLPDGTEVEVVVRNRRDRRHAAIQRVLGNPITRPVGMAEIIEEDKREREERWWPEGDANR